MKPNMVLNIVGIILILIAGVGIAVYDEPEPPANIWGVKLKYSVTFTEASDSGPGQQGNIADGDTLRATITLDVYNLTSVYFLIDWTDQYPVSVFSGTVSVTADVSGPGSIGTIGVQDTGNSGTIIIEFTDLNTKPEAKNITIDEGKDINAMMAEEHPAGELGYGPWSVTINVERSSPRPVFGTVDFRITSDYDYYSMKIEEL